MKKIALMMLAVMSSPAAAGLFGPSNYDECVLTNLKGVSSDMGARMVAAACARQFPDKKPAARPATKPPAAAPSGAVEAPGYSNGFADFKPDPPR
jgi:hypothetical protein